MADEIVQAGESPPETSRIAELEGLLTSKVGEMDQANCRIGELEQKLGKLDNKLVETSTALTQAVASYRALVIRANPGVMEELISGESIEQIDTSLEKARALVARVRQGLDEEAGRIKVPAGAPPRAAVDLSGLSAREKIQFAIGGKK